MGGWLGGRAKTKLILISTQIEVAVEVRLELGNIFCFFGVGGFMCYSCIAWPCEKDGVYL